MAQWVTVFGGTIAAQPRIRGPEHRQLVQTDHGWRVIRWEWRAGAWHEDHAEATAEVGSVIGADRHPPIGVKVSRPAPGLRQVELSHHVGRMFIAADPEGYAR